MRQRGKLAIGCLFSVLVLAFACDETMSRSAEPLCSARGSLLHAPLTPDPSLSFVGGLGRRDSTGLVRYHCSAVLVAERRVVTAKHCVLPERAEDASMPLVFGVGADLADATDVVDAQGVILAEPEVGGYTGLGSDVAVVSLARPVNGVQPVRPGLLNASDLQFTTYGYGATNDEQAYERKLAEVRRGGAQSMRATQGNVFEMIYGSFDNFVRKAREEELLGAASSACSADPAVRLTAYTDLTRVYQRGWLLPGLEAWLGRDDVEPQTCFGDSGGPLLAQGPEGLRVVAVASWSWRAADRPCAFGTVYALFSPDVLNAIALQPAPAAH